MTRTKRMVLIGAGVVTLAIATPAVYCFIESADPMSVTRRLAESGKLIGRSEAELHTRYGPSGDPLYFKGWDDRFMIGDDGTYMAIDHSWLVVRYDALRHVTRAEVLVD